MKGRFPKWKKCPKCVRSSSQHKKEYHPAMSMMYIRIGGSAKPIQVGWYCRNCGYLCRLRKMDSNDII